MKPLILIAAPGAGVDGDAGFRELESEIRSRVDPADLAWIYTSSRLLERAQGAGQAVLSSDQAVARVQTHTGVAVVLSLHLMNGREYGHLSDSFAAHTINAARLTRPLLESTAAAQALTYALLRANPIEADEVRILVTHGSPEAEGVQALAAFGAMAQEADPGTKLVALLGEPGVHSAVRFCLDRGDKKACLVPMLLTGGPSAQSLGKVDDPVLAPFRSAGIPTRCQPRGLLAIPEVRKIWLTRLEQVLQSA